MNVGRGVPAGGAPAEERGRGAPGGLREREHRPGRSRVGTCAFAVAALLAAPAALADGAIVAVRATGPVHLDGHLDEAAWSGAPVFADFVESFPRPGTPASFRTEARVVHDGDTLYVGVRCFDPEPRQIVAQLARRDSETTSDRVEVALDTNPGGNAAYAFSVNAAGVLRDQLLFADVNARDSWDAVWQAAVSRDDAGWSAEFAIPFRQLRFSGAGEQRWRVLVRRHVPRTHQVIDSTLVPREANPVNPGNLVVSRFGPLSGLADVEPRRGIELIPYVAARATGRPQFSDPARPHPRMVDPSIDFGLDLRMPLTRRLTLSGAVNPEFGQVETDQVIQNLQNAEPFFPEKRPFFLEGLDIFEPVGSEYGVQQQLFYSRRIGLTAPILGAVKVTGAARPGLRVGVLDSVVMGAGNASLVPLGYADPGHDALAPYEADPDRRWRFRPRQPFHLGPENALPAAHPVTTNYFAAVARQGFGGGSTVGATVTAASPLEDRCRPGEFPTQADYLSAGCDSSGSNAVGLDLNVPGEWGGFAQVAASQATGGPRDGRRLQDGTILRDGDVGFGGHMRAGKLGGEPWRFDVQYVFEDARFDLNGVGFQPLSNYQWVDLSGHYVRPNGVGPFHSLQLDYLLDVNWTADGSGLPRGINTNVFGKVQLPGYQVVGSRIGVELPQYDTREIAGAGVPFERPGNAFVAVVLTSEPNRPLYGELELFTFRTFREGAFPARTGYGTDVRLRWTPHARLETRLDGAYGMKPQGPRWVDTVDDVAIFAAQDPELLSLTLRQQLVFTPRLSAQLYAQLFSSAIRYDDRFYGAPLAGRRHLDTAELTEVSYAGTPASHDAVVNVNAVLRWEYRLGSTLFLVYTRSQSEFPAVNRPAPSGIAPSSLLRGPLTESLMVKWTWWWEPS